METENNCYLRFPTIHRDSIAFVAEDDIWCVSATGGKAQRLTNTPGKISHPRFSPDGQWIAYSAADDGSAEVYVMPATGGDARRLTYHPCMCLVVGWHPDGRILFRSNMESPHRGRLEIYAIAKEGGNSSKVSIGPADAVAFDGDGSYCALQRGYVDPAVWKRYKGGRQGKIWYGNVEKRDFTVISDGQGADVQPFFHNGRIFFASDRDGTCNIYSIGSDGSDLTPHTTHRDYYVRWPSYCSGKVVYQLAASLWLLDLASGENRQLDIQLQSCSTSLRERFVAADKHLSSYHLSSKKERTLINSRGKIFWMGNWKGATRELGNPTGVRHKLARWLPCGEKVIAVDDQDGDERIALYSTATGKSEARFSVGDGYIQQLKISPDGKKAAVALLSKLFLLSLENGESTFVDSAESRYFREFNWSPDSAWLAYSKYEGDYASIFLYSIETKTSSRVTTPEAHDYAPCFDPEGKYLYFLSKRTLNPYADSLQNEYAFPATAKPYLIVLKNDEYSPFSTMASLDKESEDDKGEGKNGKDEDKDKEKENGDCQVVIDIEGLPHRIVEIPVKEGNYLTLSAIKGKVILFKKPLTGRLLEPTVWDNSDKPRFKLIAFDLNEQKEEVLLEHLSGFCHDPGAKKMIVQIRKRLRVVNAGEPPKANNGDKPGEKSGWLELERIKVRIQPRQEWRQMFYEAWRWQRDFFWNPQRMDVDWQKARDKYSPLLERIRCRSELTDLLWELYGELGTSHAYVMPGESPDIAIHHVGVLGADLEFDESRGQYRFAQIYPGDIAHNGRHSPLVGPGIEVNPGDYLLAINGEKLTAAVPPYCHLLNLAGNEVALTIAKDGEGEDTREITIKTLGSDLPLRYREWVKQNRVHVAEKTENRVGYLHVPDMSVAGLIAFHRDFLWQYEKDALIVDVRSNGGGNVSPILISKLQRKVLGYCKPRYGNPEVFPYQTMRGPIVVLCDEYTGSDGDIFCQAFKSLQMGKLIGTRTWGGVVGIIADKRLVDGGTVTQPEFAFWFNSEGWKVENYGVEPDIEIENDPDSFVRGEDKQLERGIAEIVAMLQNMDLAKPDLQ